MQTYRSFPLVRGLQFYVNSTDAITVHQSTGLDGSTAYQGCSSFVNWTMCIHPGCISSSDALGFVQSDISHSLTSSGIDCNLWFGKIDSLFRGYLSKMRAIILGKKTACCGNWTSDSWDYIEASKKIVQKENGDAHGQAHTGAVQNTYIMDHQALWVCGRKDRYQNVHQNDYNDGNARRRRL